MPTKQLTTLSKTLPPFIMDGSIASFHYDNWRALHHRAICITWSFCPPVSMVKDAVESIHLEEGIGGATWDGDYYCSHMIMWLNWFVWGCVSAHHSLCVLYSVCVVLCVRCMSGELSQQNITHSNWCSYKNSKWRQHIPLEMQYKQCHYQYTHLATEHNLLSEKVPSGQ